MHSYDKIICRTVELDWWLRSKMPYEYMEEVFGVTPEENPKLADLLIKAGHGAGLKHLFMVLPYEQIKQIKKHIIKTKQIKVRLHHIRKGECIEVWESKKEEGKQIQYFARGTITDHSWSYLSDAPHGYCEKIACVENDIEFIVCDKNWNVILFDGNNGKKFPNGFFTLDEMCKLKWAHIKENKFPDVKKEGLSAWLESKKPKDISSDDNINWDHFRYQDLSIEVITSFTWIGEKYQIMKVHRKHTICDAEWFEFYACREDRDEYKSYAAWFGYEFPIT